VRQVAGVNHEIRCVAEVVDLLDRVAERAGDVRVGRPGESDVAVADLGEPQGGPGMRVLGRRGTRNVRNHLAANHGEAHRRPEPSRVSHQLAATHVRVHRVTTTLPRIIGWMEQT
jgi:peptidoglycan/xylan/chitin deacetylase (PgdA/CDA1 family)